MSLSDRKIKKYNIYMPQLMNLIFSLNPEEHRFLLKNIEKLLLDEKRISPRKACNIPVSYIYNNRTYNSSIVNISRYGCFIQTEKPLLVGEKILLDIQWDGADNPIIFSVVESLLDQRGQFKRRSKFPLDRNRRGARVKSGRVQGRGHSFGFLIKLSLPWEQG